MTMVRRDTYYKECISISARRDGTTHGRKGVVHLGKNEHTVVLTGHRGIVRLSGHGVNLFRRFLVRAYS
jgi:hypothetical protein